MIHIQGPVPVGHSENRDFLIVDGAVAELSSSGVLLGDGAVLISGYSLMPFLSGSLDAGKPTLVRGCSLTVSTELHSDSTGPQPTSHAADFMGLVRIESALQIAGQMISRANIETITPTGFAAIGLLRIRNPQSIVWPPARLQPAGTSSALLSSIPRRGDPLLVLSSPFGMVSPRVFRNSLSTGTVSNLFLKAGSKQPALMLSDTMIHVGAEGGGVADAYGALVGLVAPPLERGTSKGRLEFMIILPIDECWSYLLKSGLVYGSRPPLFRQFQHGHLGSDTSSLPSFSHFGFTPNSSSSNGRFSPKEVIHHSRQSVDRGQKSLACIRVGKSWASGILLNMEGYILTCAHLFTPFVAGMGSGKLQAGCEISVKLDGRIFGFWENATLVYMCTKSFDMALIKLSSELSAGLSEETSPALIAPESPILPGQPCVVIGHALFEPSLEFLPTVSKGIVSKVTYYNGLPAIVQSTASVLRGDSGGMLVDDVGNLLGLITSNARSFDGNIIPSINFCVPKNFIAPLVNPSTALEYIQKIDKVDLKLQKLWNLEDVEMDAVPRLYSSL